MRTNRLAAMAIQTIVACAFLAAASWCGTASAAIYWTEGGKIGEQNVGRANLDGTNADPEFIVGSQGEGDSAVCGGMALAGSYLYWAANARGTIGRANVNGSEVDRQFVSGIDHPCDVTLDPSYLYWTSDDHRGGHWIGRANLDGSGVERDFFETGWNPCALTAYEGSLLGRSLDAEKGESGIYETPSDGQGPASSLFPEVEAGCGIAISEQFVYWTDFNGFIGRAKLDGSLVEPHFIQGLTPPCGLAIYDGALYWTETMLPPTRGEISSANLDGSGLRRGILTGLVEPCGIAVDGRLVPPKALPPPPPIVHFGPVRHNPVSGAIRLAVDVSRPGTLSLLTTRQHSFKTRVLADTDQVGPGRVWVKVSVGPGAPKSWPRDALRRGRSVEVALLLDFKPAVGSVVTESRSLTMWRKVGSAHG